MIAKLLRRFRVQRYANPALHEGGGWGAPYLIGQGPFTRVSWTRPVTRVLGQHDHVVKTCSVGPDMAHEDECWCKAKRYGVFGAWE